MSDSTTKGLQARLWPPGVATPAFLGAWARSRSGGCSSVRPAGPLSDRICPAIGGVRKHRVSLVIVTGPELGSTAQDNLIFNILASFAEFEREMIGSRIADARARLKSNGRRVCGSRSLRLRRRPQDETVSGERARSTGRQVDLRRRGRRDAPAGDRRRGECTRVGGLWTARQVVATLRNPVYLGMFRDGGSVRPGNHELLVEKDGAW